MQCHADPTQSLCDNFGLYPHPSPTYRVWYNYPNTSHVKSSATYLKQVPKEFFIHKYQPPMYIQMTDIGQSFREVGVACVAEWSAL